MTDTNKLPKIELMTDDQIFVENEYLFNQKLIENRKTLPELFPKRIDIIRPVENYSLKFFFFGCWNNDQVVASEVMNNIIADHSLQFGIVNGDNYYHNKIDGIKIKIDDITKIDNGFDILKRFKKDIYLTLGNHEVNFDESDTIEKVCRVLLKEISIIQNSNIQLPNNYYSVTFKCYHNNQNTKFVFLDTNLMDANECYNEESRLVDLENMINWLEHTIKNTPLDMGLIIIGHLPLFHLKKIKKSKKTKKGIDQSDPNEIAQNMLNSLMDIKPTVSTSMQFVEETKRIFELIVGLDRNIYYLASDTHNYQHIVHKNITEIIVGTAGADLDDIQTFDYTKHNNEPIREFINGVEEPFLIYQSLKKHGHVVFETTIDNSLIHNFIPNEHIEHKLNNMSGGSKLNNNFNNPKIAYDTHLKKMRKTFLV